MKDDDDATAVETVLRMLTANHRAHLLLADSALEALRRARRELRIALGLHVTTLVVIGIALWRLA